MNAAQHAAMKLAVTGSLAADSNRETRRGTYAVRELPKRCPKCGYPGGLIFCPVCHKRAA